MFKNRSQQTFKKRLKEDLNFIVHFVVRARKRELLIYWVTSQMATLAQAAPRPHPAAGNPI